MNSLAQRQRLHTTYSKSLQHKSPTSTSVTASQAKNEFGRLLEIAMQGERVVITKRDVPKVILLSIQDFNSLAEAPETKINDLTAEFDAMLDRMQRPGQRRAMQAAFSASPKKMGAAAVAAARKRA